MKSDGKQLETLVRFVEETLLPQGFVVNGNERIYNDEGVQIAELDIEVRGRIGSTDIAWLIECRDRPSSGPAPGSWVEQLVGRRARFGFNKVTAVSTTGFADGAIEFAQAQGIELREVQALDPGAFSDWLHIQSIRQIERVSDLHHAALTAGEDKNLEVGLQRFLARHPSDRPFLRNGIGEVLTASEAFVGATRQAEGLFTGLESNGPGRKVQLEVQYAEGDRFIVDTDEGPIPIATISFRGELRIRETLVPLVSTALYRRSESGETISELASFAPQQLHGRRFAVEFHRIDQSGEIHVLLRRLLDEKL